MYVIYQLITLSVFFLFSTANAVKSKGRRLKPEEFGEIHNKICYQVRDRIAQKKPESRGEAFRYLTEELLTLCDEDDVDCQVRMHEASMQAQFQNFDQRNYDNIIDDVFPFTFNDIELKNTIKDIYFSVNLLDTMSVEDIQSTIRKISNEYGQSNNHEAKKELVALTASIAASSTELWVGIFSDPNDAFHKLYNNDRKLLEEKRGLQMADEATTDGSSLAGFALSSVVDVIRSDVVGAVAGNIFDAVMAVVSGDPSELAIGVLGGIIGSSIGASFATIGIDL